MIVDASVAMKWLVEEADSSRASALLARADLTAPESLDWEIAHALSRMRRARALSRFGRPG